MKEQPAAAPTAATSPKHSSTIQHPFPTHSNRLRVHRRYMPGKRHQRVTFGAMVQACAHVTARICNQALLNCYVYHYLQRLLAGHSLHEDKEKRLHNNPSLQWCMQQLTGVNQIQLTHSNSAYSLITTEENTARAQQLYQALQPIVESHQQQLIQLTRT